MAKVKGLKLRWNTWHAEKRIPADIKDHFGKVRFAKSLKIESLSEAISLAEPLLKQWSHLIEMARLKNSGHIVDLENAVAVAEKSYNRFCGELQRTAAE